MAGFEALLATWGLPLVTLGCFAEGDGAALVSGALAHRGYFGFWEAALAATLGAFLSDQLWFRVGRRVGRHGWVGRQLERPAPARVREWLRRRPNLAILGFRFVWGIRIAGPLAIGAAGVSAGRFLVLNLVATLAWGFGLVGIGYGLGLTIERAVGRLHLLHHLGLVVLVVAGLLLMAWAVRHWRLGRRP